MESNLLELLALTRQKQELTQVLKINEKINRFGLQLTEKEARALMEKRDHSLRKSKRVEFGKSILEKLIFTFADSQHIDQENLVEQLGELQDVFYAFKNEAMDRVTDDELLNFMKEQYETVCQGDLTYLSETCLPRFAKAIRSGDRTYQKTEGRDLYEDYLSEEQRWDQELYMEVVKELFW